jgi:FkbM family methyltransferase
MPQFLLDGTLHRDFRVARAFRRLKDAFSRIHDGVVRYELNGRTLALRLSHDLPWNRRVHPTYSENLRRLAGWIRDRQGTLRMIDVGANIGDSWALAAGGADDRFLLIEGSPRHFELLERNTAGEAGVTRELALLSDRSGEEKGTMVLELGNARIVGANGDRGRLSFQTLDAVLERHPEFRRANLLKVDVEGWDPRVLRGARRLLTEARPVVLFEHQPRGVSALGEPQTLVFEDIAALGYRRWILYDHRGWLVAAVGADEHARLEPLLADAASRDLYYDVCAFHDSAAEAREGFLAAERAHFTGLGRRGAAA